MRILTWYDRVGIIAFILSATLFGPLGCIEREPEGGPVFRGLRCRLAAGQEQYSLGETVVITVYVRNVSKEQLILPVCPYQEDTSFIYEGELVYKDKVSFDWNGAKKQTFFIIPPGVEVAYTAPEYDRKYFTRAGVWEIQTSYTFKIREDDDNTHWSGMLTSNVLRLTLVEAESEAAR